MNIQVNIRTHAWYGWLPKRSDKAIVGKAWYWMWFLICVWGHD